MTAPVPLTVLYVDDEPFLLDLAKVYLEKSGEIRVVTCQSGEKSLEILSTTSCDAIVSDYQMPGMDGLALLKNVREQYGDIPFLLFTGRGREDVVIEAINLGADFYVQKGGDPRSQFAELTHKIRMAVGRKRAVTALRERDAQLISLSDNLPSGIIYQVVVDQSGNRRFTYVSAGVERLHEVKAADILQDPFLLYGQVLPDHLARLMEAEIRARDSGTPFSEEVKFRTPSGTERWALLRSAPRTLPDGSSVWDGIELDITALKCTEEELRAAYRKLTVSQEQMQVQLAELNASRQQIAESEEKYRTLVEHTDDIVFIAQDGNLVFANSKLALLSGYALDEVIGQPFTRFIAPEDRDMVLGRHRLRQDGNALPESYGFSLLHRDQKTRIRVRIRVGAGTFRGRPATTGTIQDITKECRQEEELAKSGELHRKMVAASPDIIVQTDLDGTIVFLNDKGLQLAGMIDPGEIIGISVFSLFAPESLPVAIENTKLMPRGPLGPREYTFINFNKERVLLEVNGDILRTPDGTPYGMMFICRDIGERKRAEETLKKSEEEFRNIIENIQDVFYRTGRDGILSMISPYGARIMGYDSPEEICGKRAATEFYADPAERETFLAHILREKKVAGYPMTLRDRYGNLHYAMANSRVITDSSGTFNGIEGILHDITHLRKAEEALRQANRQITLMAGITRHDVRNQLHALGGYLSLSAQATGDPVHAADLVEKELKIVDILVQQIDFMTVFDGMGCRPPAWQDPVPLLEKAQSALPFRNAGLEVSLPAVEILADPLLEKVFYNLFDNALRHGGKEMTTLRAYSRHDNGSLVLVIEDNGEGIPECDKTRLFDRGYGKNSGLGLFLAKEVLAITGMSIRETGTHGRGARFEIVAPKGTFRMAAPRGE